MKHAPLLGQPVMLQIHAYDWERENTWLIFQNLYWSMTEVGQLLDEPNIHILGAVDISDKLSQMTWSRVFSEYQIKLYTGRKARKAEKSIGSFPEQKKKNISVLLVHLISYFIKPLRLMFCILQDDKIPVLIECSLSNDNVIYMW